MFKYISMFKYKAFSIFQILSFIQKNPSHLISKQLGREDFSIEQLPIDSYIVLFLTFSEDSDILVAKCMRKYFIKRFYTHIGSIPNRPLFLY